MNEIWIIGGGLAGSEAAWQIAQRGGRARLFEMRPAVRTPAHQTDGLGELVCSNSFKSDVDGSAPHQLKWELRRCGSLLISIADRVRVPAGAALAVDREKFSEAISQALQNHPSIRIERSEVTEIPEAQRAIIATGPLTSPGLSRFIQGLTGEAALYFYDAISPIIEADSIDWDKVFRLSRYGRGALVETGHAASLMGQQCPDADSADYVNCPMTRAEYDRFYDAVIHAESVPIKEFEKTMYFEACLPVEELARRGPDTLRFGPMKPVGLPDPRTGKEPYAVVQLRQENLVADAYNIVGFQTHLRYGEQQRVFRMIPGLERAEFVRLGQIHRNTFINAPRLLTGALRLKVHPEVYFAGQICGVEGYVESIATGLAAGWNAWRAACGEAAHEFPRQTAIGCLLNYIAQADPVNFQPMNINFGLFPVINFQGKKEQRRARQIQLARQAMEEFLIKESQIKSHKSQVASRRS
ncbi:MAG TPA: methylenetetrahydrofolate--tRNA-(uracil(54)-C(5))-methyltransferase (FADH(2)-oxidizing) TrmFO [Acidobacteriota bacterium]|jgi:methylenetetrahydrofolate--tRNA-(uracil-5-)-methyltransferase|nr:methylenetetrahydrofolate--tRNA-(uracil(54)-C(5))-methyltransferase (FADH(2)-oxidizing) TrmFO [Acidobacteriota bacterium]